MPYFIEIPLSGGETILAEVTSQVEDLAPVGSRRQEVLGRLPVSFSDALDRVQTFAGEALSRMRKYPQPPDRVSVEFGLKFSAKAGIVIAESAGEAHLSVTAEWCRPPGPGGGSAGGADTATLGADGGA